MRSAAPKFVLAAVFAAMASQASGGDLSGVDLLGAKIAMSADAVGAALAHRYPQAKSKRDSLPFTREGRQASPAVGARFDLQRGDFSHIAPFDLLSAALAPDRDDVIALKRTTGFAPAT